MKILLIIKKCCYNFYYYISWGTRSYEHSKKLDILLIYLENIKITTIILDKYYCTIKFEDNSNLRFWNENRWYAWMSQGDMYFSNGKIMSWNGESPSYEILHKYKKIILEQERINKSSDLDFQDCLPIKYIRKLKLKKLK